MGGFPVHFMPKKMEPIEGSETWAYINQTPGNYPKGNLLYGLICVSEEELFTKLLFSK